MATRGSRRKFRTLRLPSSELIKIRSSCTSIQTGELFGEPSDMRVEIWAKLGRDSRARTAGSSFITHSSSEIVRRVSAGWLVRKDQDFTTAAPFDFAQSSSEHGEIKQVIGN